MEEYLKIADKAGHKPNFFMSAEYVKMKEYKVREEDNLIFILDEGKPVFPVINKSTGKIDESFEYYFGFLGDNIKKRFLGYNYIYNPKAFNNLSGKHWKVFRRNINQAKEIYSNAVYIDVNHKILKNEDINQLINELIESWFESRANKTIYDRETMINYCFMGSNRKVLFNHINKEIFGLNIFDENHMYVNFRYTFTLERPHLSKYLRYLFFTDNEIQRKNKLINDGGDLGNENLRTFKRRLNPLKIEEVFGYGKN